MVRIPEHTELEIDSVISRQNVAKEGWTTYYVDGTNGNDANNGLRWETAFKTIQHAVDVAESWAKIYVRDGTYYENVTIPSSKSSLALIGESWKGVIIDGGGEPAVRVLSDSNVLHRLFLKSTFTGGNLVALGNRNHIEYCYFEGMWLGAYVYGDSYTIKDCEIDSIPWGFFIAGNYNEVFNCKFSSSNIGVKIWPSESFKLHDCQISNASEQGVYVVSDAHHPFIYHNNFISNNEQIHNSSTDAIIYENYYDDHSNIDNGFGIATEPYTFTGGSDPRPVVCRNGWLVLGHGGNTIKSVPVAGSYTHPDDTNEHDVLEFSAATQDIHISLDVSALTQPVEVREYEKIDGTNYRQISLKIYPDDFDTGTDAITIYFKQKNKDYKVTLKSTATEGASRSIPYVYRTDGKV
ncbi:hypothetical protein DRN97_02545 [Methanosarcinales archaeon]|nr:MAG: hypothetical protein DRN97_02545 [Methanosarcinales archaeon]